MDLENIIVSHLPQPQRRTMGGWISFNCPCCVVNGEPRNDTKGRGGIKMDGELISYHCFNCGFTASHRTGRIINKNFTLLLRQFGIPESDIKRMQLDAIRQKELVSGPSIFVSRTQVTRVPSFEDIELPEDCRSLEEWIHTEDPPEGAILAAKYLIDRGIYDYVDAYWSPDEQYSTRVIFPFFQGDRVVGFTARDFTGKAIRKYLANTHSGFLYNVEKVKGKKEKYLIVVEGVIDAAILDCCAIMTNEANDDQIDYINQFRGEVIVCPDRDKAGEKLINQAIENGWSVAFPEWENDIKDVSDAVQRYGKLYTLKSIIDGKISNSTKISVKMRLR